MLSCKKDRIHSVQLVVSFDQTFVPKLSQSSSAIKIKESDYAQGGTECSLELKISLHCSFYLVSVKKQVYIFGVKGVSDSRKCFTYLPVMC